MKFGKKIGRGLRKFGKKMGNNAKKFGKKVNVATRQTLNTVEKLSPILSAAALASGNPQYAKTFTQIGEGAARANETRGNIYRTAQKINFDGNEMAEQPRNNLLA